MADGFEPLPPIPPRRWGRVPAVAAGVVAGAAAGVAIAWAVGSTATTPGTGQPFAASAYGASSSTASSTAPQPGAPGSWRDHRHGFGGLNQSGTVTAVGASSVTIKTSSGTKTYAVTSSSDIDKNGEAKLSDLKVGDAVRFDTATVNGKTVIGRLHAGNEALDRPAPPTHD
jgi:hypothetical protein